MALLPRSNLGNAVTKSVLVDPGPLPASVGGVYRHQQGRARRIRH